MSSPNPRTYTNQSKPGGWFSVEDFMNELTVFILASSTVKALAVAHVDTSGNQVSLGASTAFFTNQVKVAVTGTAVQFGSNSVNNGAIITANKNNVEKVTLGGSGVTNTVDGTGNGLVLDPGGSISIGINNTNLIYLNGSADDWVSFVAY